MFGSPFRRPVILASCAMALSSLLVQSRGAPTPLPAESPVALADLIAHDLVEDNLVHIVARMSPKMAAALSQEKLRGVWTQLAASLGAFVSYGEAWSEKKGGVDVVHAPLEFEKAVIDLKLAISAGKIVGLFFAPHETNPATWTPPLYAKTESFEEIPITFGNKPETLPGVLSLPRGVAKPPVVILVHGSGPLDRDETIGPNKAFRDLAFGLSSRGVAVLRYDKRTKLYPGSFADLKDSTVKQEVLDDVAAAIEFLRGRGDVDAHRITVLGHSLGGMLAPRIAADNPNVSRIVILAGATRPLADITIEQLDYLATLDPEFSPKKAEELDGLRKEAARVRAARPGDEGASFLGVPLSYWADLNAYDPAATAARLAIPILVLQGDRDYQVTAGNYRRFEEALRDRPLAELHLLSGLNHQFMAGKGRSTPREYQIPGHVDGRIVELIANFVLKPSQGR
jgi:uncharacterized protein